MYFLLTRSNFLVYNGKQIELWKASCAKITLKTDKQRLFPYNNEKLIDKKLRKRG